MAHSPFDTDRYSSAGRSSRRPSTKFGWAAAGITGLVLAVALASPAAARCIPIAGFEKSPRIQSASWRIDGQCRIARTQARTQTSPFLIPINAREAAAKKGSKSSIALPSGTTEIVFLGHSSFLLRTHQNITAITDYNGSNRAPFPPTFVTMNHAHNSHYTDVVEPGVKHILKGWREKGVIPRHDVIVKDLRVTNVPTNIREGMSLDDGIAGNSIFIFESAGLCVVHLGHLHHRLKPSSAGRVGSVDIMLVPADNSVTMDHALLMKVIDDLKPEVIIPMHYEFRGTLEPFLERMRARKFVVRRSKTPSVRFSKATLPAKQTVLVLPPRAQ
jgi:L-ascorbate metabolism protein UlaG (beta-lactamase superfamily)